MKPRSTEPDTAEPRRNRDSGGKYRALVQHAVYGILSADRNGAFLAANPALAEMLGYESDDELATAVSIRDLQTSPAEFDRLVERFGTTVRVRGFETEWRRKDGSSIAVRLSGRLLYDDADHLDGFELMVEDVTERAGLESQLRQAQKMEAIGQLTGGIAHDFNNLLQVILATADLLAEPIETLHPQYKADLDNLRSAAHRGSEMARKLLGYSRRGSLALDFVNLGKVTANACAMLRPLLPENIEMRVQRADKIGASRADAGAVEQILMNLVTNARDAMPNGGVLSIDVQRAFLDAEHRRTYGWGEPGEYVMISMTDTGVGMDADTRRRMFEPFFTTKALGAGTGLGMPMVFGLVKQHGGYIDVDTMVGKGTSVRTYFPVAAAGESPVKRARSTATPRGTESILVAEDEEGVRRLARRSLEGLGYEVTVAVDGQEALEFIQAEPSRFQLVVCDVGMPRLSGLNLYRAVRAADIPTPFVLMSAYNADDLRADDRLPPAVAFLRKPWTLTDLGRRVRDVLDTAPARSVVRARTVLVVLDDDATRNLVRDRLTETGARVTAVESTDDALRHYRKAPTDLVVTDLAVTEEGGGVLVRDLRREFPDVRILAVAGPANRQSDGAEEDTSLPLLHAPFSTAQLVDAAAAAMQGGTEQARLERA